MAIGDVKSDIQNIANNAFLDVKPPLNEEWVIHNILYGGAMELYKTNGTITIKVDNDTTIGGRIGIYLHCTNSVWYQIKNISGALTGLSYDGKQTK